MSLLRAVPIALLSLCLLIATPVWAETIEVTGAAGADGASGADGDPGQPGSDGLDAEDVLAVADAPGEDNVAIASGARGGDGGDGGDGIPDGSDGGDGGSGGDAGDATARAIGSDGAASATARALGFTVGGEGGAGGSAVAPGTPGADGAAGAPSALQAEATIESNRSDGVAATAHIGEPDFGPFRAQEGTALARSDNLGTGSAAAEAIASSGRVEAYASNAGAAPVNAIAELMRAGSGSEVWAEGHSTGGADVLARVEVGTTGTQQSELDLRNRVSGSTSGELTLRQWINRGSSSGNPDLVTGLQASNPGGGALVLDLFAASQFGSVTLGDVVGSSTHGADVEVDVLAAAQTLLLENPDSGAPTRIHGESNGGAVHVDASLETGLAANGLDGADFDLVNQVTGSTTGDLTLQQTAVGGFGVIRPIGDPGSGSAEIGSGGNARSELRRDAASASLELFAEAIGGAPGDPFVFEPANASRAGDATAVAEGSNSAGSIHAMGLAEGGEWRPGAPGGGGEAEVQVRASTTGNGNAVSVGLPLQLGRNARSGAVGGDAPRAGTNASGNGGNATSSSLGEAADDAEVEVYDVAVGGAGTEQFSRPGPPSDPAGDGGDASSGATASGGGASRVFAKARAVGGAGGFGANGSGRGGDATSTASAEGLGTAEAWALALGGESAPRGAVTSAKSTGGSAHARATGTGASGFARAEAATGEGRFSQVRAVSEAALASTRDTAAVATYGAALASEPGGPDLEALAFLTADPLASDRDAVLADNDAAAATFGAAPSSRFVALGHWQAFGTGAGDGPLDLSTEFEIILTEEDAGAELALAAFGLDVSGDAFEGLDFALEKNGASLGGPLHFDSTAALIAHFEDNLLGLGAGWLRGDVLTARFQLALGEGTSLSMGVGFARIVPEPGTGSLLLCGLVCLARRRRRASA